MKYLGTTGLTYLCKKISAALAGKLSLDGGAMHNNASITLTNGLTDPVDAAATKIEPGTISTVEGGEYNGLLKTFELQVSAIYPLNYTSGNTLSFEGPVEFYGDSTFRQGIIADTADSTVTYTSGDNLNPTSWTDVDILKSGEAHKSLLQKISVMFKNMRYLKKSVNELENSKFLGWHDTFGPTDITLQSGIISLTYAAGDYTDTTGLYLLEGSMEVLDTFTGTLAMQIDTGSGETIYDTRYIPPGVEVPSMRISTYCMVTKNNYMDLSIGQENTAGAKKVRVSFSISKFANL